MKKSSNNNNNEDRLTLGSRYHHNNEPHGGHDLQTNKLPQKYENYDARRPTEKKGISQNAAIFFLFFFFFFPPPFGPGAFRGQQTWTSVEISIKSRDFSLDSFGPTLWRWSAAFLSGRSRGIATKRSRCRRVSSSRLDRLPIFSMRVPPEGLERSANRLLRQIQIKSNSIKFSHSKSTRLREFW